MWLYWFVLVPGLTRLFGYLPGARLKLGADLPGAVARQWARWGRSPDPEVGAVGESLCARLSRYPGRLLAFSSPDDDFAPPSSVRSLLGCFPRASVAHREVEGETLGLEPIDHLDFFREHVGAEMWPEVATFLEG